MKDQKIVLVTGSSRGIGKEIVQECAKNGYRVWATMRDPLKFSGFDNLTQDIRDNIEIRVLDVTKPDLIGLVVQEIIDLEGRVDVLVNNAGCALYGPVELVEIEEVKRQFDVNVFGVLRMVQSVLPHMRKQKEGYIINMSSVGGVVSNPLLGIYTSTKHCIEAISASIASSVFPWNISVSVIEPGVVATEFGEVMEISKALDKPNPYKNFSEKYRKQLLEKLKKGQNPKEIAQLVVKMIKTKHPNLRYQTSERIHKLVSKFITDPTGNEWLETQKELFKDFF